MQEELNMTNKELYKLYVVKKVVDKFITAVHAAKLLNITDRQVRNLKARYLKYGAVGLRSRKRGKPSNRPYSQAKKTTALEIIKRDYFDYGPLLAAEKLGERNGIYISKETARAWMTEANLWQPNQKSPPKLHPLRERRAHKGELLQIDGSPHFWFETRGPYCTLIVFIDDATSEILELRFAESENTFSYFDALENYLINHGKPLGIYSDRHSVFKVNYPSVTHGTGITEYGRVLDTLSIDRIYATSPQARERLIPGAIYFNLDNYNRCISALN